MDFVAFFSHRALIAASLPSAVLVAISYWLFFRSAPSAFRRFRRTALVALISPVVYIPLIRAASFGVSLFVGRGPFPWIRLSAPIATTTILSLLLFIGGVFCYQRIVRCTRLFALLIYGDFMGIAVVSVNMPGIAKILTALVLCALFVFCMRNELPFLAEHDRTINYKVFVVAFVLSYVLVIGSMSEVYILTPQITTPEMLLHDYAWCCVIAFIFSAMLILLQKTLAQNMRTTFTTNENLAQITQLNRELTETQDKLIQSFSEILEGKSGQSGNHVKRVSEYAGLIASALGLDEQTVHRIKVAAMMHDCGKLMIPNEILEKPGRLTDEEFAAMKQHVRFGEQMLKGVPGSTMQEACLVASQHHERWDGKGYLNNLTGDSIAVSSRIVAVADVFDALTSVRSYKDAWSEQAAYEEIVKNSGTQFAPDVVAAFQRCFPAIVRVMHDYRDRRA